MISFGFSAAHDEAGVDEDVLAAGDEGVHGVFVDDVDVDVVATQAGGIEQRVGVGAQRVFDLGVADQRLC